MSKPIKPELFDLKAFDRRQKNRRIRPKQSIDLPVQLVINPTLPPSALRVYGALKYLQIGTKPVIISRKELVELTGLSIKTVMTALNRLRDAGLLDIIHTSGNVNSYQV